MKLAEVIHHDYSLVPVINRFGIPLGFGDGSIREICEKHEVNTDFFLSIINTFHDPQYFPSEYLKSFPALELVKYLRKAHTYYINEKIPEIKSMIGSLFEISRENQKTLKLINNFFEDYCNEFINHVQREEQIVYPYVLSLEKAITNSTALDVDITEYSIRAYEADHEDIEEKLYDMKSLLIKYLPPEGDNKVYLENSYQLLRALFVFEKELNEHSRIEDLILVPKVEKMEEQYHKINF